MGNLAKSRHKFIIVYVRCFRHYITGKLIFPIPPKKFIRLSIRADKFKAYQDRKRSKKTAA